MLRTLKRFSWLGCLALSAPALFGFSLLGPNNEGWQVPVIGYNPYPGLDPLNTGPKNLGEEYRRNTPVLYYTFDANFIDYFGTNGIRAVEEAIAVFNGLTNVSSYSRSLGEFPTQVTRENYQAGALQLFDLKSITMNLLIEQLGLAAPERYIWTLHDRQVGPGGCPADVEYLVVRRNFDPVPTPPDLLQASSYVNGTLYSYWVYEDCGTAPEPTAEAIEFPVDPLDFTFTTVASGLGTLSIGANNGQPFPGKFYTGLTRDDVGGLRFLYNKNNYNWEDPGPTSFSFITNTTPQLLFTSNLTELAAQALTNSPAALQALYPGLVVGTSTNWFQTVWVTNITPFFINSPFSPVTNGTTRIGFTTNRVLTIQNFFQHTFANLFAPVLSNGVWTAVAITNFSTLTNFAFNTLQNVTIAASQSPFAPAGSFVVTTDVTSRTFGTNTVVGEYFILPTNACEVVLISPQLTITNVNANILSLVTNTVAISNAITVTNIDEVFIQTLIDYSTTHVFAVFPVACLQSNLSLAGGIERVRFERRDFDSLLGRFFNPFTNSYSINIITNNTLMPMRVFRSVTQPDFLFTAQDLTPGPAGDPSINAVTRNINFNTNGVGPFYPGLAGPGTIEGPTVFTYNKAGPVYYNYSGLGAFDPTTAESSQIVFLAWGSYDATTNRPVVFPNGEAFELLENNLFIAVFPTTLSEGALGQTYADVAFTVTGGTAPYRFTLAPNSPGLPPGLTLSNSGMLSGTPSQRGTFDFILRMTDATGRYVDRAYTLKINW